MLMKLNWEITQFKNSLVSGEAPALLEHVLPAYHAYNCAVTAWHCVDWAWRFGDKYIHQAFADLLGFSLHKDNRTNLRAFVIGVTHNSRAIYICRLIANGSKHMKLDRVDPTIRAMSVWARRENPSNEDILSGREYGTRFYIVDGSDRLAPEEVFDQAFQYWHHLFQQVGYAEPSFVGPDDDT